MKKGILFLCAASLAAFVFAAAPRELNGYDFYPAGADAKPFAGDFGKLPTGAREFEVELPRGKGAVVNAADFGLNERVENAATIINSALAHCKKIGASKLVLPKGRYKCFDATSIMLEGFEDFTLDGNGSLLVYQSDSVKQMRPQWDKALESGVSNIKIRNCKRVRVANLDFDWDWERDPLAGFAKVVGRNADPENPYVDFQFFQYEKYPTYGRKTPTVVITPYRADFSAFAEDAAGVWGGDPAPLGAGEGTSGFPNEWISPNTIRIYFNYWTIGAPKVAAERVKQFREDLPYRIIHYYYGKNAFDMFSNRHLTLENIRIFSCRGHAFQVDGEQQFWQYVNVKIMPPDDPRRALSCSADHHHIVNSRGFMKMIGCEFSMGTDDVGNFHDRSFVMKKAGEKTLESANARGLAFFDANVGDEISLRDGDYANTGYVGKIASIDGERITFDKPLPDSPDGIFVCFNTRFDTRNIIVRDCKFVRHGARGLLILAKDVLIENTLFEREQLGALKLETGYTFNQWCEGTGVDNVVVRNCTFRNSNLRGIKSHGFARDIQISAYIEKDPSTKEPKTPVITNALFENNKFYETAGVVAVASACENIIFRNNRIENARDTLSVSDRDKWYRGGFYVRSGKNIKIVNNTFVKSPYMPNAGVLAKRGDYSDCDFSGNRVVEK